jgi:ABC-type lipoprotein release transport system permease subunit
VIRHLKLIEYALGALGRRFWKNLSLVFVYTLTIATIASVLLFSRGLREEAARLLAGAPELLVQRLSAGRHDAIPETYLRQIAALPGVAAVRPRSWGYVYDPLTKGNYTLMAAETADGTLAGVTGRLPRAAGEAALGAGVAAARKITAGDDLILIDSRGTGRSFTVTGVFTTASALLTNDLVLLESGDLRDFFGLPDGLATDLAVTVRNPREVNTLAAKIKARLPDTRPITRADILRTYEAVFDWRSGMLLAALAPALAAFAILAWDRASGLSAEEKREIGVLKAVGWGTGDILMLKFWEGLIVSGLSLALGVILAEIHLLLFDGALLSRMLKGWSVLYPSFRLTPVPDADTILALALFTIGPYLAATVVPAWKSAVTDPDTVLRG